MGAGEGDRGGKQWGKKKWGLRKKENSKGDGNHVKCCLEDKRELQSEKNSIDSSVRVKKEKKLNLSGDGQQKVFINMWERSGREKD